MNGKGDKDNRISDRKKYRKNFDLIFSAKKPVENLDEEENIVEEDEDVEKILEARRKMGLGRRTNSRITGLFGWWE
jgi:hypothetical protein